MALSLTNKLFAGGGALVGAAFTFDRAAEKAWKQGARARRLASLAHAQEADDRESLGYAQGPPRMSALPPKVSAAASRGTALMNHMKRLYSKAGPDRRWAAGAPTGERVAERLGFAAPFVGGAYLLSTQGRRGGRATSASPAPSGHQVSLYPSEY